jgi:hypothetical protein
MYTLDLGCQPHQYAPSDTSRVNLKRYWASSTVNRLATSTNPADRMRAALRPDLPVDLLSDLTSDPDPRVAAAATTQWLDRLAEPAAPSRPVPPRG